MADLSLNYDPALAGTSAFGDLTIKNGDLLLTSDFAKGAGGGTEPVTQAVAQRVRTLLGEFFLNTQLGVPYFQQLFGQKDVSSQFEASLQRVVLATPGVLGISSWQFTLDRARRSVALQFRAQTTAGAIVWGQTLNPQVTT